MKKYTMLLASLALSLALIGCSDEPAGPSMEIDDVTNDGLQKSAASDAVSGAYYEVIIENLTPATGPGSSQPFSPPILATHRNDMHVFKMGEMASDAIEQVAEDAVGGPLLDLLHGSSRVHDVAMGGGVIHPGADMVLQIEARPGTRNLSMVFMLVNTNDAFGGLDGVHLPAHGEVTFMVPAFDAGTEMNTELTTDIPGPCCGSPGMGTDEDDVVRHHMGITGMGDLSAETYGWEGYVARVTVRRID